MAQRLAVFAGSFDPLTNGHASIISRSLNLFDHVVVAVTVNVRKRPMFSADERMQMIRDTFPGDDRLSLDTLDGLLAQYARAKGAVALIRGLRAPSDFEYELQMAQMNRHLTPDLETVFLAADAGGAYISSSLVKEVAALGGDVSELLPAHVHAGLMDRLAASA